MSEDRKWEIYIKEKAKLMQQNLTCAEYEKKSKNFAIGWVYEKQM